MKTSARYEVKKIKIYVQRVYLGDGRNLVALKECSEGGQHMDVSL